MLFAKVKCVQKLGKNTCGYRQEKNKIAKFGIIYVVTVFPGEHIRYKCKKQVYKCQTNVCRCE